MTASQNQVSFMRGYASASVRSRYEITYTSFSIPLRLLMPFRNVSAQLILCQRRTDHQVVEIHTASALLRAKASGPRSTGAMYRSGAIVGPVAGRPVRLSAPQDAS